MDKIFDKLLFLPLFQGVTHERLEETVEKFPFHFLKFKRGETIVTPNDSCTHVRFVLSGGVNIKFESNALKFNISSELNGPDVIFPDYLFGLDVKYPFTLTAAQDCGILQLAKQDYVEMLQTDKVYLYNILNYLSRNSQVARSMLLDLKTSTALERLIMLVTTFTSQNSKNITLTFKHRDFCHILGARRPIVVSLLNYLIENGIIEMPDTTTIKIIDRNLLIKSFNKSYK